MARSIRRPLAAALLLEFTAMTLAGCGAPPTGARLETRAVAKVAAPAAAPAAQAAATKPVAAAPAREVVTGPAPIAAPAAQPAPTAQEAAAVGLFDHDYDPAAASRYAAGADEAETAAAAKVEAQAAIVGPGGASWGLIGGAIGGLLVGGSAVGYSIYTGVIGSRDLLTPADKETMVQKPDHYGWAYEDVAFDGHDGTKLKGWYVPAAAPTHKALLLLHGHTSNKDRFFMKYAGWLHDRYNLFIYDSRFHGESEGKLTTLGWHERRDAAKALDILESHGDTDIGVMGESMGAAVAIGVAADEPSIKAVWADCAFDSLHDAIAPRAVLRGYPLPQFVAWSVVNTACLRAKHDLRSADPIKAIKSISPRPVYLVHGLADDSTTPMNSDKLFAEAAMPKTLWTVPGAHHAESWSVAPAAYESRVRTFFDANL